MCARSSRPTTIRRRTRPPRRSPPIRYSTTAVTRPGVRAPEGHATEATPVATESPSVGRRALLGALGAALLSGGRAARAADARSLDAFLGERALRAAGVRTDELAH